VLLVKRPAARLQPLDKVKILVAHEEPSIMEKITAILTTNGYKVIPAKDGIEAMVNATKEMPFLAVLGVSIPKIYGFEVCKRLKGRPETKDMKIILIPSVYDMTRYRREPESLHDADDYIEEHLIEGSLIKKIEALKGGSPKESAGPSVDTGNVRGEKGEITGTEKEKTTTAREGLQQPFGETIQKEKGGEVERARRLARTIIADIYLYSKAKVDDAIKKDSFHKTFASDLKEGFKLYEKRVPAEIRAIGDFFNEAINNFIEKRRREIA
jgi:response regulator RpfG family c-di-GMP phosphodiesterase